MQTTVTVTEGDGQNPQPHARPETRGRVPAAGGTTYRRGDAGLQLRAAGESHGRGDSLRGPQAPGPRAVTGAPSLGPCVVAKVRSRPHGSLALGANRNRHEAERGASWGLSSGTSAAPGAEVPAGPRHRPAVGKAAEAGKTERPGLRGGEKLARRRTGQHAPPPAPPVSLAC